MSISYIAHPNASSDSTIFLLYMYIFVHTKLLKYQFQASRHRDYYKLIITYSDILNKK